MAYSFLRPDRRFRPAGFPSLVRGSPEGNSFTGYNNVGITIDDGRYEHGYHLGYRSPPRWSQTWGNAPASYLNVLGLSCEGWRARTPEERYWAVKIGLRWTEPHNVDYVIRLLNQYC